MHPGFISVASHIAHKEHVPISRAKAILASSTRRASMAAKIANPDLLRVKGRGAGASTKSHTSTSTKADTRGNKTSTSTITLGGPRSSGKTTINVGKGFKQKRGRGWEEEMAKAIARDKETQEDKAMADRIRTAAMTDAKKRGGSSTTTLDPIYEMIDVERRHPHFTVHANRYTGIHKAPSNKKRKLNQGEWYDKKRAKH